MKKFYLITTFLIINQFSYATVVNTVKEEQQLIFSRLASYSVDMTIVFSPQKAFNQLIVDLEAKYTPVEYLQKALPFIRSVKFVKLGSGILGIYNRATKVMTLGLDFISSRSGLVKPLSQLTTDQIATVYHEFWHVYRDNIASKGKSLLYRQWSIQSRNLYRSKGSSIHDEAYGLYVEELAKNYLNFYDILARRDVDGRIRLKNSERLGEIYLNVFNFPIHGYYRNWRGKFITSKVNLPLIDRLNVENNLLGKLIIRNYKNSFPESKF